MPEQSSRVEAGAGVHAAEARVVPGVDELATERETARTFQDSSVYSAFGAIQNSLRWIRRSDIIYIDYVFRQALASGQDGSCGQVRRFGCPPPSRTDIPERAGRTGGGFAFDVAQPLRVRRAGNIEGHGHSLIGHWKGDFLRW